MPAGPDNLDEILSRIVAVAHPLKVILFGSRAASAARPDSDVDLLVVVRNGTHRGRTAEAIYRRLAGIRQPVDVVVTEQDVETYRDLVGTVIRPAMETGRTVYAA